MKRLLSALALSAFSAAAVPALAADTDTAASAAASSNEGVIICRVAKGDEKPNARIMIAATTLVCKPIDSKVSIRMIGKVKTRSVRQMGPNLAGTLTPGQMDAAWHKYLDSMFNIVPNLP
ncbi:MAG: hypothetical protein NVSMB64_17890 [Candidatus Velthaea sp.]